MTEGGGTKGGGLDCQELVELVTDYLEGALDPDTERRFTEHVEACEGCAVYLAQMRATLRVLGSIPAEAIEPAVRDRLLQTFRNWSDSRA
jgi:anti-sigma factor RsiW